LDACDQVMDAMDIVHTSHKEVFEAKEQPQEGTSLLSAHTAEHTATVSLELQNVYYDKLKANKMVLANFKRGVQKAEVNALKRDGLDISPDNVQVDVEPGSSDDEVDTKARIKMPTEALSHLDSSSSRSAIMTEVVKQVQRVPGIDAVESGAVYGSSAEVTEQSMGPSFLSIFQSKSFEAAVDRHRGRSLRSEESQQARKKRARDVLRKESSRLGSAVLAEVGIHLNQDTFGQVKELIQGLITRLAEEANQEATTKHSCDKNMLEAANTRDNRMSDVNEINAELTSLGAKEDTLLLEIEELKKSVSWLGLDLASARKLRLAEKAANMKTIGEAKQGIDALKSAQATLKALYHQTEMQAHTASYTGAQTKGSKILGLLAGMQHNFETEHKAVSDMEEKHERVFINYYGVSSSDMKGKQMKEDMDEESLAGIRIRQAEKLTDLQTNMDLLDGGLKDLKALVPVCVDSSMSWDERKGKREQEIAALKVVLCALDTDGVEKEDCP